MTEIQNFYDKFLKNINTKMLTDEQRGLLNSNITTNEYFEALKSFQKKQSTSKRWFECGILPWLLASHMEVPCQCLKFCSWTGTTFQLTKIGYDYFDRKEWQRQTFYNVIARRLEQILPYLIYPNQKGFIKERSIVDGLRCTWNCPMFRLFCYPSDCRFRESIRLFKSYLPP